MFRPDSLAGLSANDLVLAVRAGDDAAAAAALQAGSEAARSFADHPGRDGGGGRRAGRVGAAAHPRARRCSSDPEATVAIVSVPGPYAALEAHHALNAGLHVLLFSDNVPVEEEVELKRRGADLGLLVMGPGAGTADPRRHRSGLRQRGPSRPGRRGRGRGHRSAGGVLPCWTGGASASRT